MPKILPKYWIDVSIWGKAYGNVPNALTNMLENATDGSYLKSPYPIPTQHL